MTYSSLFYYAMKREYTIYYHYQCASAEGNVLCICTWMNQERFICRNRNRKFIWMPFVRCQHSISNRIKSKNGKWKMLSKTSSHKTLYDNKWWMGNMWNFQLTFNLIPNYWVIRTKMALITRKKYRIRWPVNHFISILTEEIPKTINCRTEWAFR